MRNLPKREVIRKIKKLARDYRKNFEYMQKYAGEPLRQKKYIDRERRLNDRNKKLHEQITIKSLLKAYGIKEGKEERS